MNRHFRVPPEHQELWVELKKATKIYFFVILFWIVALGAGIYLLDKLI